MRKDSSSTTGGGEVPGTAGVSPRVQEEGSLWPGGRGACPPLSGRDEPRWRSWHHGEGENLSGLAAGRGVEITEGRLSPERPRTDRRGLEGVGTAGNVSQDSPETQHPHRSPSHHPVPTLTGERAGHRPASLRVQLKREAVGSDTHSPCGCGFLGQARGDLGLGEGPSSN